MVVPVVADMNQEPPMLAEDAQRYKVWKYLDVGLITESEPRAETQDDVQHIIDRLLQLAPDDVIAKMTIAGFWEAPVEYGGIDQSCETCVYFQVHRRHCELPQIDLPVEPHWSCRLWRI